MGAKGKTDLRKPETQKAYLAAAKTAGVEIASLAVTGVGGLMLQGDAEAVRQLDDSIGVCKALGLTVSMPAFFSKLDENKPMEMDRVIGVLKEVAPRAEEEGIVFGMENSFSAEDNLKIIDGVGSSAVKVYYDTGNSRYYGNRDICKEIRTLRGRICEFHAKDIERRDKGFIGRMLGQGPIDFREVRKAIDDIRFSGWIQVEIEGARPQELIPGCRADYKYLRSIFHERA
ncbi:MAG: sugar phosphate isomerase/epimerase [Planctomycetes bacterium]|nr:sugar phosphate isomerase/epimerase [Planctomycetota bacterium]